MARLLYALLICMLMSGAAFAAKDAAAPAKPPAAGQYTAPGAPDAATATAPGTAPTPVDPKQGTVSPLTILVVDQAKALNYASLSHLKSTVTTAAGATGVRFQVFILPTLNGKIGNVWVEDKATKQGLLTGRDSVLLLISMQEKQGWVWATPKLDETMGPGVKQAILDNIVEPNLQQGNVLRAAEDGTRAFAMALAGWYKQPEPKVVIASGNPFEDMLPGGAVPALVTSALVALLIGGMAGGGGGGGGYSGGGRSGPNIMSRWV